MKVTYNWLQDFVPLRLAPPRLADKLTMAGLEVVSLEEKDGDWVFEIEVTSNRPDWLSVAGIAREVAAITNVKFRIQDSRSKFKIKNSGREDLKIVIEDKKDCPLYTAKIIRNIKVGPSPECIRKRLESVGLRSVNNIVDITNYVLFETGEPLHAFDFDKLRGNKIIVRRARDGEKIILIDGTQKRLDRNILVIADEERPVALAGVMGGLETEVNISTRNILLEAACFNPVVVRRGRQVLGLSSESSYRFERGVDISVVAPSSNRALELIRGLAAGDCVLCKSSGQAKASPKQISLSVSSCANVLGSHISRQKVKKILTDLGFKVSGANNLRTTVPGFRQDVELPEDLIEEVARINGYEHIPEVIPAIKPQPQEPSERAIISSIKDILVGLGLDEVVTYSLISKDLSAAHEKATAPEVLNPLSLEQEILRPHLSPSLANTIAYNFNQHQDYVNIFEVAKVFLASGKSLTEELMLGIALSGERSFLLQQGRVREEAGFLHLKGILEMLFQSLGVTDYAFTPQGLSAVAVSVKSEAVGTVGRLGRRLLDEVDIKNREVYAAEISLDKLLPLVELKKRFHPLPRFPAITRDVSFIVKKETAVKDMLEAVKEKGGLLLAAAEVIDYYQGKQIPPGLRGLTLSCVYRSEERTLTEAEVNPLHAAVCGLLSAKFGAKVR